MSAPVSSPLDGIRVLDFTLNLPGPYTSFMLASLGAQVIKVEPPRGDPARHMGELFDMLNRGKRSVVLDLRDPSAAEPLRKLVQSSDILLDGFRPGVMARLGCGWPTASSWNDRLIYCSITAYGQDGPRRDEPAHDLNLQALAGVCHMERASNGVPRGTVLPLSDFSTAMVAMSALQTALYQRERTGEGQYLDVAMSDAVLSWTHVWGEGVDLAQAARQQLGAGADLAGPLLRKLDRERLFALPQYGVYRCRGREYLALGIVDEKHFWKAMCEVLGLPWMIRLPMAARSALGPALRPIIAARLRTGRRDDWLRRFVAAGVPATPVHHPTAGKRDAQYQHRGLVDASGRVKAPLPGAGFVPGRAPGLGEHTESVLAEL